MYLDEGLIKLSDKHLDWQGGHDDAGELLLEAVADPDKVLEPPDHRELAVVEVLAVGARVDLSHGFSDLRWHSSSVPIGSCKPSQRALQRLSKPFNMYVSQDKYFA